MAIVGTCLLVMLFCPIISLMSDTSACVSSTGMRNYVLRDVILEPRIESKTQAPHYQNYIHHHHPPTIIMNNNKNNNPAGNVGETVGGGLNFLTSTVGNTVGGLGRTVGNVTGAATRGLGDTVTSATGDAGRPLGDGIGNLGTGVQGGLDSISKGVENAGQWKKQ
ncbi:hypothetical protein DER46DRAFT_646732 [Fusarium sp. MPI-SDFR-AT-0072]|nr:hypothetical protein DER46DRAFT_646732 [Fusarium sp. MPI-SDFR-AT-0072]